MPEIVDVPLADLLVDTRNARLVDEQPSQPAVILAIAKQQRTRLVNLASDITTHGLDPTTLPAVIPTDDRRKRYRVIEGNRRIVALRALETPSLVTSALNIKDQQRLGRLSTKFAGAPIEKVQCVLFKTEEELQHWVMLRHTGQNDGRGLVEWGAEEKDRYAARHGLREPAGQIIDFVEKCELLSDAASKSKKKIFTSLKRLVSDPVIRDRLGIEISNKEVLTWYSPDEVAKGLTRIIEDLKTGIIKVGHIYHKEDRADYISKFSKDDLPDPDSMMSEPRSLSTLEIVPGTTRKIRAKRKKRSQLSRTAVIPSSCQMDINPPRINRIYWELCNLSADQYSNACSVLLRVFIELSVDHYIDEQQLLSEQDRHNKKLALRLKLVAADLTKKGEIPPQLETAIKRIADSGLLLAASAVTFNQYVHNKYVYPKASELWSAWDEIEPLMIKLWPQS